MRNKFGVKAVEMEASGIADASWNLDVGYLAVRGICDYCDSYKNDTWQPYAAAVAAAYTRALIESIPFLPEDDIEEQYEEQYQEIIQSLKEKKLVFFLGPDINLCDRPIGKDGKPEKWIPGSKYPPTDFEIAEFLANKYKTYLENSTNGKSICPIRESRCIQDLPEGCPLRNLQSVSQYIHDIFGEYNLYNELHSIFSRKERPYNSNKVHQNLAKIIYFFSQNLKSNTDNYPLIISTIYDSTLEQ
ncbi:MAG: hypothetical protein F6K58_17935 [Symploca sp. SIO2E9]|nr:hypothetical protein [Symploca sp. SIO2E9]